MCFAQLRNAKYAWSIRVYKLSVIYFKKIGLFNKTPFKWETCLCEIFNWLILNLQKHVNTNFVQGVVFTCESIFHMPVKTYSNYAFHWSLMLSGKFPISCSSHVSIVINKNVTVGRDRFCVITFVELFAPSKTCPTDLCYRFKTNRLKFITRQGNRNLGSNCQKKGRMQ